MDINICIDWLNLNRNEYALDQSNPPHSILSWEGPDPQPSEQQLQTAWSEYTAHKNANAYKESRESEYKRIGDQLDMIYWDGVNDTTLWQDHIASVKAKYPKG